MTDAELRELYPPRRCGDGSTCRGELLEPRLSEVGLHQSDGWKVAVVWECKPCDWRRIQPLKVRL